MKSGSADDDDDSSRVVDLAEAAKGAGVGSGALTPQAQKDAAMLTKGYQMSGSVLGTPLPTREVLRRALEVPVLDEGLND